MMKKKKIKVHFKNDKSIYGKCCYTLYYDVYRNMHIKTKTIKYVINDVYVINDFYSITSKKIFVNDVYDKKNYGFLVEIGNLKNGIALICNAKNKLSPSNEFQIIIERILYYLQEITYAKYIYADAYVNFIMFHTICNQMDSLDIFIDYLKILYEKYSCNINIYSLLKKNISS